MSGKSARAPQTARDMLDLIDRFLYKHSRTNNRLNEGAELWNVLTALRGPDSVLNKGSIKEISTSLIRAKAFPKMASCNGGILPATFASPSDTRRVSMNAVIAATDKVHESKWDRSHFYEHVRLAATSLDLLGDI